MGQYGGKHRPDHWRKPRRHKISATVRILKLKRYQQLARVAELVTLVSLTAAVCNIAGDVGRPDRFIYNVVMHGNYTSPFV